MTHQEKFLYVLQAALVVEAIKQGRGHSAVTAILSRAVQGHPTRVPTGIEWAADEIIHGFINKTEYPDWFHSSNWFHTSEKTYLEQNW